MFLLCLLPLTAYGFGNFQSPAPTDVRGACPMLNTLSNHGELPRNGKDITQAQFNTALDSVLNVGNDVSSFFFTKAIGLGMGQNENTTLSLSDINGHDLIEHDASLVRNDLFFHHDTLAINQTLVSLVIASSSDGKVVTLKDLAQYRARRFQESKETNPDFTFGLKQEFTAFGEASLLLNIFGENQLRIPVTSLKNVLGAETLPPVWDRPSQHTSMLTLVGLIPRVKFAAGLSS